MDNGSGKLGEGYTADFLRRKGCTILERNYHSRYGEIDIIAQRGQYILFVEVKTRREGSMVDPLEAVTKEKRRRIIQTSLCYLEAHPEFALLSCRFDVAGLTTSRDGSRIKRLRYVINAFEGGSC
ncbi:MAG: YraN family protein [Oscillospiraceae bacterium]|nr:YraN family protein [Oscillospiraceae bacterium]